MTLGQGEDWISRKLKALEQFLEFINGQARIAEDAAQGSGSQFAMIWNGYGNVRWFNTPHHHVAA